MPFQFDKLVLLAPAVTCKTLATMLERHVKNPLFRAFRMYSLSDEAERGYYEIPILYPGSLLYIISGLLETRRKKELPNDAARKAAWQTSRFYFYTSGHGIGGEGDDTALITANATRASLNHISTRHVLNELKKEKVFGELVVFADCCRELAGVNVQPLPWDLREYRGYNDDVLPRAFIAYASRNRKQAFEPPADSPIKNSFFTQALLKGLEGGAPGHQVDSKSLENFLYNYVPTLAPNQNPDIKADPGIIFVQTSRSYQIMLTADRKSPFARHRSIDVVDALSGAPPLPCPAQMPCETIRAPVDRAVSQPALASGSRIVLMATHATPGRPAIDLARFQLLDSTGKAVAPIADNSSGGSWNACKLFTYDTEPGCLVLEGTAENFPPDTRIRQPLWCSDKWCTLIFLSANSTTGIPDLNTASVYQRRIGDSFAPELTRPNDRTTRHVLDSQRTTELALHSLVGRRSLLSAQEIDAELLVEKFSNPMLGILGCYPLLNEANPNEKLIATVLRNLDGLVPNHPDVTALKIKARRIGLKILNDDSLRTEWPPMLCSGFLTLRDEDWERQGTIRPGSLCDHIRTRILSGSLWTRWIAEKGNEEFLPGSRGSLSAHSTPPALTYAKALVRKGKSPRSDDLKWSGLNRRQASAVLRMVGAPAKAGKGRPALSEKTRKVASKRRPKKSPVRKRP
jgi:hypothetical protein